MSSDKAAGSAEMPDFVATPFCLMAVIVDDDLDKQQVLPNPIPGSAMWSCSSATNVHCTSSAEFVYNRRSPRPGEEYLVDLCGGKLVVEWFGMLDLVIHGSRGNVHVTLNDIAVVPEFRFKNVCCPSERLHLRTASPWSVTKAACRSSTVGCASFEAPPATTPRLLGCRTPLLRLRRWRMQRLKQHSTLRFVHCPSPLTYQLLNTRRGGRGVFSTAAPMLATTR